MPGGTCQANAAGGEVDAPARLVQTFQNHLQTLEFEDLGERTKLTQGGFARVDELLQRLPL